MTPFDSIIYNRIEPNSSKKLECMITQRSLTANIKFWNVDTSVFSPFLVKKTPKYPKMDIQKFVKNKTLVLNDVCCTIPTMPG